MEYETDYNGNKIVVRPAEEEGYEATVTPKGCQTAVSWNDYPNATQALSFAKDSIDNGSVPQVRKKIFGIF